MSFDVEQEPYVRLFTVFQFGQACQLSMFFPFAANFKIRCVQVFTVYEAFVKSKMAWTNADHE